MNLRFSPGKIRFRIDAKEWDRLLANKTLQENIPVSRTEQFIFSIRPEKDLPETEIFRLEHAERDLELLVSSKELEKMSQRDGLESVLSFGDAHEENQVKIILEVDLHAPKEKRK